MTRPLVTFSVRPERLQPLSVRIEIYETVGGLRAQAGAVWARDRLAPFSTRKLIGLCYSVTERAKVTQRLGGTVAVVMLAKPYLSTAVITHEAFHATLRWADRAGIPFLVTSPETLVSGFGCGPEERCATAHDRICRRIVVECERRGLYT